MEFTTVSCVSDVMAAIHWCIWLLPGCPVVFFLARSKYFLRSYGFQPSFGLDPFLACVSHSRALCGRILGASSTGLVVADNVPLLLGFIV